MNISWTEREMLETKKVCLNFDFSITKNIAKKIGNKRIIFTGMGSSLLFPGKQAKNRALKFNISNKIEAYFASIRFAMVGDVSKDSNLEYLTAISVLFGNMGYLIVFLLNIYLQTSVSYLISFCIVFFSLIISLPVLKLNTSTLKEKLNL